MAAPFPRSRGAVCRSVWLGEVLRKLAEGVRVIEYSTVGSSNIFLTGGTRVIDLKPASIFVTVPVRSAAQTRNVAGIRNASHKNRS
jgi:hypothetical protein